jgi:transcriptional regulator with XRE-family HTH domain
MKTVGEKLKKARIERGVVQRKMARDLGVSVQTICNVENENRFSVGIVEKIAKYLGVEVRAEVVEVKN